MLDEEEEIDPLEKGINEALLEIVEHEANIAELEIFLQELNDILLKTELEEKEDTSRIEKLQEKIEPLVNNFLFYILTTKYPFYPIYKTLSPPKIFIFLAKEMTMTPKTFYVCPSF